MIITEEEYKKDPGKYLRLAKEENVYIEFHEGTVKITTPERKSAEALAGILGGENRESDD